MTSIDLKRRRFPAALLFPATLLTIALTLALSNPLAAAARTRETKIPASVCDYDWRKGEWHVKQLIRCAADRWRVPGGARMALYVASRESHYRPKAYNTYSGASGVFQHLSRYWPGRADAYGFGGWSAFNARANIMVTMRMVRSTGDWSDWNV